MAYAVKYLVAFSDLLLRISKKDYVGDIINVVAGSPAVVHRWEEDNPIAPIKGSSIEANIIGVPLLDFYANNDDEFKGELFKTDETLIFSGYLVQDDCSEDVDDLNHMLTLTFTDNLGLLKDITFNGNDWSQSKLTLFQIVTYCTTKTGVSIPLNVFADLREDRQGNELSFLHQTLIAKETFLKGERTYNNCYEVLEAIMATFNATILQAFGKWQIVRWFEKPTQGFAYNATFASIGSTPYPGVIPFGYKLDVFPEYGLQKRIMRPYQYVKETFDYETPNQILKNADLQDLNGLLTTYTMPEEQYKPDLDADSTNDFFVTVKEYVMPYWFDSNLSPTSAFWFIRVITDNFGNEMERYAVVQNDGIMSTPIEGSEGDSITFGFSVRAGVSVPLPATLTFVIRVTDGTRTMYADDTTGGWKNTVGYQKTFTSSLTDWNSVEIKTGRLPFDGLVTVFLRPHTPNPANETHFNDMRFTYTSYINESTKITGHTHTSTQNINIKSNSDEDITIDDSPRNFISGTLFLTSMNGAIQARTSRWNTGKKLGEIVTGELKQWRSKPRTIIEGNLYGETFVSPMNVFTNPAFPMQHFVPGNMEIEYATRRCSLTLHELYQAGEATEAANYKFDYIYDTK